MLEPDEGVHDVAAKKYQDEITEIEVVYPVIELVEEEEHLYRA
ncbi:hypothetical protein RAA17_03365 [Komagataeibacter rhaeticus]|nr:hypothetical protein [Komagataeibacter rhaeticus]